MNNTVTIALEPGVPFLYALTFESDGRRHMEAAEDYESRGEFSDASTQWGSAAFAFAAAGRFYSAAIAQGDDLHICIANVARLQERCRAAKARSQRSRRVPTSAGIPAGWDRVVA